MEELVVSLEKDNYILYSEIFDHFPNSIVYNALLIEKKYNINKYSTILLTIVSK